jgi:hypothetical protein
MSSFRARWSEEQAGERFEVAAEPGDRAEVRSLASGQEPECGVIDVLTRDRPRGAHPGGVAVDQQPHHQPRVVGRVAALFGVAGQDRRQIEDLVYQVGDEPGQVVLGQPVVQRRRQQQDLVRVERPKGLADRRWTLRPLLHDRLDLEQSFPITHTEIIPSD